MQQESSGAAHQSWMYEAGRNASPTEDLWRKICRETVQSSAGCGEESTKAEMHAEARRRNEKSKSQKQI